MTENGQGSVEGGASDADRHLTFEQALRAVLEDITDNELQVERIEIRSTAAGDVSYRYCSPRAAEMDVGFIPRDQDS